MTPPRPTTSHHVAHVRVRRPNHLANRRVHSIADRLTAGLSGPRRPHQQGGQPLPLFGGQRGDEIGHRVNCTGFCTALTAGRADRLGFVGVQGGGSNPGRGT